LSHTDGRNSRLLRVHETTLTTKSDAATCKKKSGAAGFSKVRVSELFILLEKTVEHKVNAIRIHVHSVYENAVTTF
jgi:hypothetical protein